MFLSADHSVRAKNERACRPCAGLLSFAKSIRRNLAVSALRKLAFLSVCLGLCMPAAAFALGVDLVINVSDAPDPLPAGGVVTYTINIANNGDDPAPATGVTLSLIHISEPTRRTP